MGKYDARLFWILVDCELHHVGEYSHLKPQERPIAFCPVCNSQIVMKLGPKKVFHAAHKSDDNCPATNPETALHLNAKLHIAQQLRKKKPILVETPCVGLTSYGCHYSSGNLVVYMDDWNQVFVEYHIDQYRPDIVLLKDGEPVGAVEVFVTHAIEPEKEQHLQKFSIPWVEVDANSILPDKDTEYWEIESPLPIKKLNHNKVEKWVCPQCEQRSLSIKQAFEDLGGREIFSFEVPEFSEQPDDRSFSDDSRKFDITAFRAIDVYFPENGYRRIVYCAQKCEQNGAIVELRIVANNKVIFSVDAHLNFAEAKKNLQRAFEWYMKFSNKGYMYIDSHMIWQKATSENPEKLFLDDTNDPPFPKRYYWHNGQNNWIPVPAFSSIDWNKYFFKG